jgi:S1-C subfamily serine protease
MQTMMRTWSLRSRPASSRSLRGLAVLAAFVLSAGMVGFVATEAAGAQSSGGQGGLNVAAIESKVDPAVAVVNTTLANGQGEAAGTGIVIGSSGEVLTNNHVIENSSSVKVQFGGTGRSYSADVLGYNVSEDVALLKVDGVSGLDTVRTDDTVSVGEPVVALGNAGGRGGTPDASTGAVRGVGETIQVADSSGSQTLRNLIRVDASLQPGDSGGPLLDAEGDVVGMNTAASSGGGFRLRTGSGSGEGYAVPIKTAMSVADQIKSGEGSGDTHVGERAFLGVSIRSVGSQSGPRSGSGGSRSGAVVGSVQSGSPADDAGLQQGDTITSLAGKSVSSIDDLTSALAPHHPRDKVEVGWTDSSGDHHTAQVTLASGPPA